MEDAPKTGLVVSYKQLNEILKQLDGRKPPCELTPNIWMKDDGPVWNADTQKFEAITKYFPLENQ